MKNFSAKILTSLIVFSLFLSTTSQVAHAAGPLFERTLILDGVDNYAIATDNSSLDVGTGSTDDFTLETFFYVPNLNNDTIDLMIVKGNAYDLYIIYSTTLPDRFILKIHYGPGPFDDFYLPYEVNLSVGWHHVAGVFNNEYTASSDLLALYVDGVLGSSGSNFELTPGLYNSSSALNIGANFAFNPTVGLMEEVRISNAVRYTGSSYTVPAMPFTTDGNTRALWHFDETVGATTFTDSSGNNNTLSGLNGAQVGSMPVPANVSVLVAGTNMGNYSVAPQSSVQPSYAGLNNGPVKVVSTNGTKIVASERVAYSPNGGTTWTSYSELMGLPVNQLATSYTFPWYNNLDLNSQLRFGNVGTANTTVTVTIGGVFKGSYNLAPNASHRVSYAGLDAGPVKVTSSGNVPIIASMRVAYFNGSKWTSFSEIMGMPTPRLTNSYVFPWYNNLDLNSQLRFGNVGAAPTTVTVTVGGVFKGSYPLAVNESKRVSYAGLDAGPVKVTSSGNVPIIASMRVAYNDGTAWTDFSEMMGMPANSLSSHYSFPVYDNVHYNSQLRFGNVGTTTTTVTVKINGVVKGNYTLAPNASQRISYAGVNSGPVVIQSSGNVPIIASQRVAYNDGSAWTSFAEMMGLPQSQLSTTYLFPWYNNFDLNTQIRFGVP